MVQVHICIMYMCSVLLHWSSPRSLKLLHSTKNKSVQWFFIHNTKHFVKSLTSSSLGPTRSYVWLLLQPQFSILANLDHRRQLSSHCAFAYFFPWKVILVGKQSYVLRTKILFIKIEKIFWVKFSTWLTFKRAARLRDPNYDGNLSTRKLDSIWI